MRRIFKEDKRDKEEVEETPIEEEEQNKLKKTKEIQAKVKRKLLISEEVEVITYSQEGATIAMNLVPQHSSVQKDKVHH